MNKLFFFITVIGISVLSCKSKKEGPNLRDVITDLEASLYTEPGFDSIKAFNYGADEYGMHKYVIAFLKKGPNRDRDSAEAYQLQIAHLENIGKMADEGKLLVAGPFLNDGDLRGIYIFNVETVEEAQALTGTDPAIKAGSLVMELHPWYGSAALVGVNDEHKRVAKTSF